ncbi:unnamed protein product [Lymnaea stagnalis]|uniref:Fucolectin tachylectin-4 pentraxin-1 domain-containing protein n=1 Tax=Lymnaea stagnalis TaxID=6523 RepID=A0AAV2HQF5_LYMST
MSLIQVTVLIISLFVWLSQEIEACEPGWFGSKCQYMCHCAKASCLGNGACLDGDHCMTGWFGPKCQYQDSSAVATITTTPRYHSSSLLTDGDDESCILNIESITVVWNTTYPLSWIRVIGGEMGMRQQMGIRFKGNNTTATFEECFEEKTVLWGPNVRDVYCTMNTAVNQLVLAWEERTSLCSIHISGGRNIALRQAAKQSSNYSNTSNAEKAVDGIKNNKLIGESCTHTNGDKNPFWMLTFFNSQKINRIIIYNRYEDVSIHNPSGFAERLSGFSLEVYNNNSIEINRYTDKNVSVEQVYTVTFLQPSEPASMVKITIPTTFLTLCEVEIFGDSSCPAGWYGPECNKKCQCSDPGEACLVMTGGCSSGCAPGYYGESCDQECLPGYWGVDCLEQCSSICYAYSCARESGRCLQGCTNETDLPECKVACDIGWFGPNCQYMCHCTDEKCDVNGLCLNDSFCEFGWFGPGCQYVDLCQDAKLTTTPPHNLALTADADDETCVINLSSISLEWTTPIAFTWVRLVLLEPDYRDLVTLSFKEANADGTFWNCTNLEKNVIDKRTTDFYCDVNVVISQIVISLKERKSVCSLYVSGGRNIALRQYTHQSSTSSKLGFNLTKSSNAVDGSTVSSLDFGSCSHTETGEPNPSWTVTFLTPQIINRYVIYNNFESIDTKCCPGGLQDFRLTSVNIDLMNVFSYTDATLKDPLFIYNIPTPGIKESITSVTIASTITSVFDVFAHYLSFCEVEIYGDSACPNGTYGRECRSKCNCAVPGESCFVSTGGCPSGCAPGFYGEGCATECSAGSWGIDCRHECSSVCNNACNRFTGDCVIIVQ